MRLAGCCHRFAIAVFAGAGLVVLAAAAAQAGENLPAAAQAAASDEACQDGQLREGRSCMHRIAPPGACATAHEGSVASGGGAGGACGDGDIGVASQRFSPVDVAVGGPGGPAGFNPPAPGPAPGPQPQPCDIGCGPPGGGGPSGGNPPPPPPAPSITVIESPAVPDPLPGLP